MLSLVNSLEIIVREAREDMQQVDLKQLIDIVFASLNFLHTNTFNKLENIFFSLDFSSPHTSFPFRREKIFHICRSDVEKEGYEIP